MSPASHRSSLLLQTLKHTSARPARTSSLGRRAFAQPVNDPIFVPQPKPAANHSSSTQVVDAARTLAKRPPILRRVPVQFSEPASPPTDEQIDSSAVGIDAYVLREFTRLVGKPWLMQTSFLPDSSDPQHPKSAPDPLNIPSLAKLLAEYDENSGRVLDRILPGQVTTPLEQRPNFDAEDTIVFPLSDELSASPVAIVAHVAYDMVKETEKIALCSGFFIRSEPQDEGELPNRGTKPANQAPLLVSCGHTLEEMRRSDILSSANCLSATLVLVPSSTGRLVTYYASSIPSSLPLSDLALFSVSPAYKDASARLRTLPVNPYPATESTAVRIHLASFSDSASISADDHTTHENDPLVRSEWENGSILGYRDRDGREAFPGTYDSLAHILYRPIPTPGSSGGPIIDAETMSVIGIVTGDAMVNRVEGRRGFGTPAEALFEMFSLPGLPKKQ